MTTTGRTPRLTAAGSKPISGSAHTHFVGNQVVAGAILLGLVLVGIELRRYAAAKQAGWSISQALHRVFVPTYQAAGHPKPQSYGLLVGKDRRLSTSKVIAALWTVVVAYLILVLACIFRADSQQYNDLIKTISPLYLVELGGPFAATVLASSIVGNAVNSQQTQKSTASGPRASDVYSDDDGNADLVDTQYLLFNFIAAGIVLVQFAYHPGFGAPSLPDFIAILTGTSAATYVANKGLTGATQNLPVISRLTPNAARAGARVTAFGTNFIAQGDIKPPSVLVGGIAADTFGAATANQVTFKVPLSTPPPSTPVNLVSPSNAETTTSVALQVVADAITIAAVDSVMKRPGDALTLYGSGFYNAFDVDENGRPIGDPNPQPGTVWLQAINLPPGTPQPAAQQCTLVPGPAATDSQLVVQVPAGILAGGAAGQFQLTANRAGLQPGKLSSPISISP